MNKENTSVRLKQIMKERQLRQVDILEKCKPFCQRFDVKLGRNDLSQYVNGKVEPRQEKLSVLGYALNVSEAWLMGFDVPMERTGTSTTKKESPKIITYYNQLNPTGKEAATEQVRLLTLDEKYTRLDKITQITGKPLEDPYQVSAAHENPDATKDDKQFDEDLMDNDEIWS